MLYVVWASVVTFKNLQDGSPEFLDFNEKKEKIYRSD